MVLDTIDSRLAAGNSFNGVSANFFRIRPECQRHSVSNEKAAHMRGSFIGTGQKVSYHFFLPITQMQIFLNFSAFVAVFQWFFGLMIQLAEWVFWIPDSLRDNFHHSFHNIAHVTSYFRAKQRHCLPCWPAATACATEYKTDRSVCHSNFYLKT